jgi:hypothetical protein
MWEQKFLKTIFRTLDLTHLSRSPKDSKWFKSKNCETAIPTKVSFSKIPMKLQLILTGADFSRILRYSFDKKIVVTANSFQLSGS